MNYLTENQAVHFRYISGGQNRRIALERAMVQGQEVLLVNGETTNGAEAEGVRDIVKSTSVKGMILGLCAYL